MSNSEKSNVEDVVNLDFKGSEGKIDLSSATEESSTGTTTESVTSINLSTTESINSKNLKTMKSVTGDAKDDVENKKQSAIIIAAPEVGNSEQQRLNKELNDANAEYLARLVKEMEDLRALPNTFHLKHAVRLVSEEIAKVREIVGEMEEVNEDRAEQTPTPEIPAPAPEADQKTTMDKPPSTATGGKKVFLQEKIFVPVQEYPNYNFVGRILGPRGMTAKQLEEESGCRIMIRGRGSTREGNSHRRSIYDDHLKEELHVLVQCEDFEEVAQEKMKRAVECIRHMLIPPPEGADELKRKQLMELSIINGTYRPTIASRIALRNRPLHSPFNFGRTRTESAIRRVNNLPVFSNGGGIEDDRHTTFYDLRTGGNIPYRYTQHYPYNSYTVNTRQALATLGFDMDAFEVTDYYSKRLNRSSTGIPGSQAPAATAATATAQYSQHYGFGAPLMDPFTMQYMWDPAINSPMFGVFDNSSSALAREYYSQVMAGIAPTINSDGASFGDGMAQSSNAPPVNLQQYITAAALLNGGPNFRNDGSGDGPGGYH